MATFYLGQIFQFAGDFTIKGTAMCNGQQLPINQNQALFAILGTTYGGNGQTTFALPDLRGRDMVHMGQLSGGSTYTLGQKAGAEIATLSANTIAAHSHSMTGSLKTSATSATLTVAPANAVLGAAADVSGNAKLAQPAIYCPAGTATTASIAGLNVSAAAAGQLSPQPFTLLTPYLVLTQLMALVGVFPSRN